MAVRWSRARGADEALVRSVYEQHGRALLAYATRLTKDRAAAEDVVQSTLVRAWRRPELLAGGRAETRGRLLRVVRDLVVDDIESPQRPVEVPTRYPARTVVEDTWRSGAHAEFIVCG
jgi:RNA polymerase sigma-70 factor (ECF subfamily)